MEVSPASFKIAHQIGKLLSTKTEGSGPGGAALIVDYGNDYLHGDSFRVIRLAESAHEMAERVLPGFQRP